MQRTIATLGLVATIVLAACGGASNNAGTSPTASASGSAVASAGPASLTIMVGGLNKQIYLPNKLTEALGYFKDQNLTVNLIDEPSGKDATTTFIAAIKQGTIDAGMTTEPTISRLVKSGDGKVLIDLRTPETTKAALGGDYPFISIYMRADWVAQNKGIVQRVVNAYVKTLKWIATHSPAEIADKLPADYYAGDKDLYLTALTGSMPMFSPDGQMPAGAPDFILKVLQTYNKNVQGKTIDLTKTWTNEYVDAAK